MRQITLRRLLVLGLVAFAIVPALVAIALSFRQSYAVVDTLTERIVRDVAVRIEQETLRHLYKPHFVLNGLLPPALSAQQAAQAKKLFDDPTEFEQLAFALTAQLSEVPYLYYGTQQGNFLGVEFYPEGTRVGVRGSQDIGRKSYLASGPGDRSVFVKQEEESYEPRNRPWYKSAEGSKARTFSTVYPSVAKKQLKITLSQAVPDEKGETALVVAADLSLDRLSETLRSSRISANAASYIVDESGNLVATSTSEKLYKVNVDLLQRVTPLDSTDTFITQSFLHLAPQLGLDKVVQTHLAAGKAVAGSEKGRELTDNTITSRAVLVTLPVGESLNLKWHLVIAAQHTDFSSIVTQSLNRVLVVVMLLVLLAGVLAWALAGGLSRRIDRLNQMAQMLGRGEVPPNPPSRIADVAVLSDAMHTSGMQLQASRQEIEQKAQALEQANQTLESRVAERTSELVASREEALHAAKAKAAFLATMSHEIRTPLNGVVGMTTLLADTELDTEQRDYLHTMRVSSDQLLGVINDILDFSKIESGKLELEAEPLSLQATIEEACDIAAPRAREKGLELLADMDADVPEWVLGDVTRLRQVLLNFINNAVKFTEHGQVVVSAHLHQAGLNAANQPALIEFRVKDSGIGIPLDKQSALFQSFSQVDTSTTRKYGGTGLGLAICKRLASIMQGEVGVHSAPGAGSTFWFTAQLWETTAPDNSQVLDGQTASLAGKLALVVDDTALNLRILDKQLKRWGMRTVLFERAQPALDWLASCAPDDQPDVIITDMHMPEMDGQTFTQTIRARTPDAHVVLLTSGVMPSGPEAKVFDARLLKPYRQSQLFNALSRVSAKPAGGALPRGAAIVQMNQHILVADDNAINLKVALAMLAKLGYTATTAVNGREAADLVSQSLSSQASQAGGVRFAAVLMDVNMPVMDGLQSAALIVASHGAESPPIIALTASVLEEDRQRCLDAGMQGFLTKPLRIDELGEALARYAVNVQKGAEDAKDAPDLGAARAYIQGATALKYPKKQPILMDWSRLEQFKEFDDDAMSMTREVVALFVSDAPGHTAAMNTALNAAVATSNPTALAQAAHALKGAALNIGATALSDACAALEASCLQGQWPLDATSQVRAQVNDVNRLSEQTLAELHQWGIKSIEPSSEQSFEQSSQSGPTSRSKNSP